MRLIFVFLFLFTLAVDAQKRPNVIFYGVMYCPLHAYTTWLFLTQMMERDNKGGDNQGEISQSRNLDESVFYEMVRFGEYDEAYLAEYYFNTQHGCTKDGSTKFIGGRDNIEFTVPLDEGDKYYSFKAINLITNEEPAELYEKLFLKVLPNQCKDTPCDRIIDDFKVGCGLRKWGKTECLEGLKNGVTKFCKSDKLAEKLKFCDKYDKSSNSTTVASNSSTTEGSSSVLLIAAIIGIIVAIIISIGGYCLCKRLKKKDETPIPADPKTSSPAPKTVGKSVATTTGMKSTATTGAATTGAGKTKKPKKEKKKNKKDGTTAADRY